MKFALVPDGWFKWFFEWVAIKLDLVPAPFLVRGFLGMGVTQSFVTGAKLGFFDVIGTESLSAAEVARKTECDLRGTEALLNALSGFGYLKRRRGRYSNTLEIRRWYLASSRWSMREIAPFIGELWKMLERLEEGVRTGAVPNFHYEEESPEFWRNYLRALATFANLSSKEVARRVPLKQPAKMLDVGGGHGTFSMAFCKRHPGLQATVLDLAPACVVGEEWVAEHDMEERVHFRPGDLRSEEWGQEYDAVLLFNLLHTLQPEEALNACQKAFRALRPGGTLVVLDAQNPGGDGAIDQLSGYNELFFFLITGGAQTWPESTLQGWMKEAGFRDITKRKLVLVPHSVLLFAQKPTL